MKLTIERSALLTSLQHVQSVVERRNTIPILSNVQLSAKGSELGLTATDMDIWVFDKTPADVGAEGSITASAHLLFDIVRKLSDDRKVELETKGTDGQLSLVRHVSPFQACQWRIFLLRVKVTGNASFECRLRQFAS